MLISKGIILAGDSFNREEADKKNILARTTRIALLVSKALAVASVGTGLMWCVIPMLKSTLALPLGYPYTGNGSVM